MQHPAFDGVERAFLGGAKLEADPFRATELFEIELAAADIDVLMDFDHMKRAGTGLGTGTALLIDDSVCPVGLCLNLLRFFAQESCGWCTPCWAGLPWTVDVLNDIEQGRGRPEQLDLLVEQMWFMGEQMCFCDLAPSATKALGTALKLFRDDFERHIHEHRCSYRTADTTARR